MDFIGRVTATPGRSPARVMTMEDQQGGKPPKTRGKTVRKKISALMHPFMKVRVYQPLQKEKHTMQHSIDVEIFQDTPARAFVKLDDHFSQLQLEQQQHKNLNEPTRQGQGHPQGPLAAEGTTFTYFSGMNAMLEMQIENMEASYQELKESHHIVQREVASLRGKLMDSGDQSARLKANLIAEQESSSYFAKMHSEVEVKNQGLEARITQEKKKSASIIEELVRVQSNLNAESESCSFFSQTCKELEGKVEELESALRRAQADPVDGEKSICQICLESPRNALCLPCRHFVCCNSCLVDHLKRNNKCPMCRASVESTIECYT